MIYCNLCGQSFQDKCNPLLDKVKTVHEKWHTDCRKNKRNTVEGKVVWVKEYPVIK